MARAMHAADEDRAMNDLMEAILLLVILAAGSAMSGWTP